jgi:3-mercaptopyruvate sulfurtransferase SseA
VDDLRARLAAGAVTLVDLDVSTRYAKGHIPGAWFAVRARFAGTLARLPESSSIVLTSADGVLATLAAAELEGVAKVPVLALAGGTQAWVQAGLQLESGAAHMADTTDDVHLMPRERGHDREAAMRDYLTWEINLVNDMAQDDDQRFKVVV